MPSFKEYVKEWLWPTIKTCTTVLFAIISTLVIVALVTALERLCS